MICSIKKDPYIILMATSMNMYERAGRGSKDTQN
jgi:hypothetical protein